MIKKFYNLKKKSERKEYALLITKKTFRFLNTIMGFSFASAFLIALTRHDFVVAHCFGILNLLFILFYVFIYYSWIKELKELSQQ